MTRNWMLGGLLLALPLAAAEKTKVEVPVERRQAVEAWGKDPAAVPHLVKALDDKDAMTRMLAIRGLVNLRASDQTEAIIRRLKTDWVPEVREEAAIALRFLSSPASQPALLKALGDKEERVRMAAIGSLGRIGDASVRPAMEVLAKDPSVPVRRNAVATLGRVGGPESAPALIAALKDDDALVRAQAAQALGVIKSTQAVPALTQAQSDPDPTVRQAATTALKTGR